MDYGRARTRYTAPATESTRRWATGCRWALARGDATPGTDHIPRGRNHRGGYDLGCWSAGNWIFVLRVDAQHRESAAACLARLVNVSRDSGHPPPDDHAAGPRRHAHPGDGATVGPAEALGSGQCRPAAPPSHPSAALAGSRWRSGRHSLSRPPRRAQLCLRDTGARQTSCVHRAGRWVVRANPHEPGGRGVCGRRAARRR